MERNNGRIYVNTEALGLEEHRAVGDWLTDVMSERTGSEQTRAAYPNYFHEFLKWSRNNVEECRQIFKQLGRETTPDDIINVAVGKLKDYTMSKWAERTTKKWFNSMCQNGLARTTAKTRYGVARSFFRHNGIKFTGRTPAATARTRYILPEKERLQKMWRIATLFEKIRVGLLNDTGLRPSDVVSMKFGMIEDSFERNEENIYIESVSEKEDLPFAVCLTKPVTQIMHAYLELRGSQGETIVEDSPLITAKRSLGQHISTNQLYRNIRDLGKKVGITMSPKYFRKRFRTECSPIIGRDATMKMAGWKIPGAGKHYFLPPKSKTVENYRKVERIICLEDVATDFDIAAQKRIVAEMLRAAGLNPERLLREANIGNSMKEQADYLTKQIAGILNIVKAANNVAEKIEPEIGPVPLV